MKGFLFTRLPFVVIDADLPVIPASDIKTFVDYEVNSAPYDHWMLRGSSASLAGKLAGRMLTPQSDAPTYLSAHVVIDGHTGKGLLTDLTDSAAQSMAIIIKRPADIPLSKLQLIFGAIDAGTGSTGYFEGIGAGSVMTCNLRGWSGSVKKPSLRLPGVAGDWMFLAVSESSGLGSSTGTVFAGGSADGNSATLTQPLNKSLTSRKLGLGSAYLAGGLGLNLEVAEFILWDRALSVADLEDVYGRAKERMTGRGLTLV